MPSFPQEIKQRLLSLAEETPRKSSTSFSQEDTSHKTFLWIPVPRITELAKEYQNQLSLSDLESSLQDDIHEMRLFAIKYIVLFYKKKKNDAQIKEQHSTMVFQKRDYLDTWDLIDTVAEIFAEWWLWQNEKTASLQSLLAKEDKEDFVSVRLALVSLVYYLRLKDAPAKLELTQRALEITETHPHPLVKKARVWLKASLEK